jgi:hypothetical protein
MKAIKDHFYDIVRDGFYSPDFLEEELPDDFFLLNASQFSEDVSVNVIKKPLTVGGIETSHYHKFDFDNDVIYVGARDTCETDYIIVHDEEVTAVVYDWYQDFCAGSQKPFPDVKTSDPIISPNCLEKSKHFVFQRYFMELGCSLLNPTWSEASALATYGRLVSEDPVNGVVETLGSLEDQDRLLVMYEDGSNYYDNYRVIGMQFNPFHPFSVPRVKSMIQDGDIFSGIYSLYDKEYPFLYNLNDDRYRVHSDQWSPIVGCSSHVNEMYDLVSNYDFFLDLTLVSVVPKSVIDHKTCEYKSMDLSLSSIPSPALKPLFVEPYTTDRVPPLGYSVIGPWSGVIRRGVGSSFYVPFLTRVLNQSDFPTFVGEYDEVTQFVRYDVGVSMFSVRRFCRMCIYHKSYMSPLCYVCENYPPGIEIGPSLFKESELPFFCFVMVLNFVVG